VLTVTTQNGSFCYSTPGSAPVPFYSYIPNLWYSISVNMDTEANTADIYLNGKLKAQGIAIPDMLPDTVGFYSPVGSGVTCIDDLVMYCK